MKSKKSLRWTSGALLLGALVGIGSMLLPDAEAQARPSITVTKQATPADGTEFTFTFASTEISTQVDLVDAENAVFAGVPAGDYTITEEVIAGWNLEEITCVGNSNAVTTTTNSVTISISESSTDAVTCTFENVRDTIPVCVNKLRGENLQSALENQDLGAGIEPLWTIDVQSQGSTVEPGELAECVEADYGFEIYAGEQFTLSETIAPELALQVGLAGGACFVGEVPIGAVDGVITVDTQTDDTSPISCLLRNDTVPVCIYKYGLNESGAVILGFDPENPPWSFVAQSQMTTLTVAEIGACEGPGFYVAPGEQFKVSETIDQEYADQIALVQSSCTAFPGEGSPTIVEADDQGVVTMTAPDDPDFYDVYCDLVNQTVYVCVTKDYEGAAADNTELQSGFLGFEVDDVVTTASPGGPCDNDEVSDPRAKVLYNIAPGTSLTIGESIAEGSPLGATDITCDAYPSEGAETFSYDLASSSWTVNTTIDTRSIECTVTNGVTVVCVGKILDPDALSFASATQFSFSVASDAGSQTVDLGPTLPTECEGGIPGETVPEFYGTDQSQIEGNVPLGFGVALIPPGLEFTVSENSTGDPVLDAQISAIDFGCSERFGQDESGLGTFDCVFENITTLVCVYKYNYIEPFEFTGTFSATADGVTVASGLVPVDAGEPGSCDGEIDDTFAFYVAPGSDVVVTESMPAGSPVGLVAAECEEGELDTTLSGQTVSFVADTEGGGIDCVFENTYQIVCVTKSLADGAVRAGHSAADFGFDIAADGTAAVPLGNVEGCSGSPFDNQAQGAYAFPPRATSVTITETGPQTGTAPWAATHIECNVGADTPVYGDNDTASITFEPPLEDFAFNCEFENDTLIVCVVKEVNPTALDAGYTADLASFTVIDGEATVEPFDSECDGPDDDDRMSLAYAVAPGDDTVTITEDGGGEFAGKVGLVAARCFPGLNVSTSDLATRTIVSPKDHGGDSILRCEFVNDSVEVTLTKELVLDDGVEASVADFLFDVYDEDGAALATGLQTGATTYVAAGSTFIVEEREAPGFSSSGSCSDIAEIREQSLTAAASVTHTPGEGITEVSCTFVNDDLAPIPVCAMLTLDEGDRGFTLDDFTLELYLDGALVGERNAGDPFDADCDDISDTAAAVLPGALVKLADVFPDGSTYSFTVSVSDPDGRIVFGDSSCSVEPAASTQALRSAAPVTFTADPGATLVSCFANAQGALAPTPTPTPTPTEPPLVTGGEPLTPVIRPVFVEPVVPAAVAPPVEPLPQVVAVDAIALTGSSTSGVTLPVAFALLSVGFVGLGLGRGRRRRQLGLD